MGGSSTQEGRKARVDSSERASEGPGTTLN
jgi:hypothetical protein